MAQLRAIGNGSEPLIGSVLRSAECLHDVRRFAAPPGRAPPSRAAFQVPPAFMTSPSRLWGVAVVVCVLLIGPEQTILCSFWRSELLLLKHGSLVRQPGAPLARLGPLLGRFSLRGAGHVAVRTLLRFEDDLRYGMNLPDRRHVGVQAGWPRRATVRVAHVEKQRAFDLNRDRRIIEIV